jgi:hypothetical protein
MVASPSAFDGAGLVTHQPVPRLKLSFSESTGARVPGSLGARRPLPGVQDGWNRKGLVGDDGTKKQAFGVLRDAYRAWPALAPAAAAAR